MSSPYEIRARVAQSENIKLLEVPLKLQSLVSDKVFIREEFTSPARKIPELIHIPLYFRFIAVLLVCGSITSCATWQDPNVSASRKIKSGTQRSYVVNGSRYYLVDNARGFIEEGLASWYGSKFHGKKTASQEVYNMHAITVAHKSLPFQTMVKVINLENHRETTVRINDRGPFVKGRIIDLSYAAAKKLQLIKMGVARVRIEVISTPLNQKSALSKSWETETFAGNKTNFLQINTGT
jgi:rare lipoprotein A (peptidoglycan hydrolase)